MRSGKAIRVWLVGGLLCLAGAAVAGVAGASQEQSSAVDWRTMTAEKLEAAIAAGEIDPKSVFVDKEGKLGTALFWAINDDNLDLLDVLVKHGADINQAESGIGLTPLHFATYNGNIAMMERLIALGADMNKKDRESNAPLIFMALTSDWISDPETSIRVIEVLLSNGADLYSINDKYGYGLLHVSAAKMMLYPGIHYGEVSAYLLSKGLDINGLSSISLCDAAEDSLECHIGHPWAAMHIVAVGRQQVENRQFRSRQVRVLRQLAEMGADVDIRSSNGLTPLMLGVAQGRNLKVVETLIALGADVEARDDMGFSVLDYARMREEGRLDSYWGDRDMWDVVGVVFPTLEKWQLARWRYFGTQAAEILEEHLERKAS